MKFHLKFKRIHATVVAATDELFNEGPWRGTDEEKATKFERWLRRASDAYGVPVPTLEVRNVHRPIYDLGQITLPKYSVIELFHTFRHHLQALGAVASENLSSRQGAEHDAIGWACSLYYLVRPIAFRKAVRDGKIRYVGPRDLLNQESAEEYDRQRAAEWETRMQGTALDGEGEELSDLFEDGDQEDEEYDGSEYPPEVASTLASAMSGEPPTMSQVAESRAAAEEADVNLTFASPTGAVGSTRLSTQEAADMLGVSTSRVLQITDRIGGSRVGRRWSFDPLAVEEYRSNR